MKIRFSIRYIADWGDSLFVAGEYITAKGRTKQFDVPMTTDDGQTWTADTALLATAGGHIDAIRYTYQVRNGNGQVARTEWNLVPRIVPLRETYNYSMLDAWHDVPLQQHLYTNAYLTTTFGRRDEYFLPRQMALYGKTLLFFVSAPQLAKGQAVAICGSHPVLGQWNTTRYLKMQYAGQTMWMLAVNAMGMEVPFEYKFVVVNDGDGKFVAWEDGDNRTFDTKLPENGQVAVIDGGLLRTCETIWKVAGVAVPVSALKSEHSYGVGDFGDLRLMVDWASATGMKAIQILPINDTGALCGHNGNCPYDIVSSSALNPYYIDLDRAGELRDKERMKVFHRQRVELNAMRKVNYEAMWKVKDAYLHELYNENGRQTMDTDSFRNFVCANKRWLPVYAAFCALSEENGTATFKEWKQLSEYNEAEVNSYITANKEKIHYIYYVQYLLQTQLEAACEYAREKGVFIICDMPIGVSRNSADTWAHAELFNMDASAGTMPDSANPQGQNWGFPTFNWDKMQDDGWRWWRERVARLGRFFDGLRIDHTLGFFRIWELPDTATSCLLGHFSPALPFSAEEIEQFGMKFHKTSYTKPYINEKILNRYFGLHATYVRDTFMQSKAYNTYELKPEFDSQEKIRAYFYGRHDEDSAWIRDGLYRVTENVLFVEDHKRKGLFHPRVLAYAEPIFEALGDNDKEAFMRLYNHYFYQRHNMFWGWHGMRGLTAILQKTRMLACAEDLGNMPDCVEPVLNALRILTLQIQSAPKQRGAEFCHLNSYPYRSVASISTHDMPPMRLWWEESKERTQRYYTNMLQKEGTAPLHMPIYIADEIVARHLYCPSMLCILALQDWLAIDSGLRYGDVRDERINTPGDIFGKWNYRMNMTIERLLASDKFNARLKTMIKRSRR